MTSRREKELKEVVEQQREQLNRYEKKLRDVIHAYKGLQKEKEALELSFKALTKPDAEEKIGQTSANHGDVADSLGDNDSSTTSASSRINDFSDIATNSADTEVLKKKVSTLLCTLTAVTEEKSRIEANFQNDRKRLIQEREELEKSLAAACDEAEQSFKKFKTEIADLRTQLSSEKLERSKETSNNQILMRELQKTISEERQMKEALQLELNAKSFKLSQLSVQANQLEIAEKKIEELSRELETTRQKLHTFQKTAKEPSPVVMELQRELAEQKLQQVLIIQQEQERAAEAEETVRQLVAAHEKRVASLEAHLSELSLTVGTYDRLRQQDLATVAILKDQLATLERNRSSSCGETLEPEEQHLDVLLLLDKVANSYAAFQVANQKLAEPINSYSYLESHGIFIGDHTQCAVEKQLLEEELEKLKTQMLDSSPVAQTRISDEVFYLQEKLKLLMQQLIDTEQRNQEKFNELQQSFMREREHLREEFLTEERNLKLRLADLEYQMKKQRERSLNLLEEKDEEIRNLRSMLQIKPLPVRKDSRSKEENEPDWPEGLGSLGSLAVGSSASGGQILHYVEELARKDIEIQGLRRLKNQLETSLRELQMEAATREESFKEERRTTQESLERLERNSSRENANLEYLKNVIFNLLTRPDSHSQSHMVNAISTILHFSPKEIQLVGQAHPTWKLGTSK